MLLIYGMVIDLVQKQSDVEGVLVQPVLITAVWCGSGEHLTIVCIADGAYCVFFFVCVQQSWTTLAGVSPVTVIASEPCS